MISVQACGLPAVYNDNYLSLLVRDPECIFAYWETTEEKRKEVREKLGSGLDGFTLRVYDVTGVNSLNDAYSYFDLDVHPMADNYFINKLKARRSYCVELGIKSGDRFLSMLRSNIVQTPADCFADGTEEKLNDILFSSEEKNDVKIGSYSTLGTYGSTAEIKTELTTVGGIRSV